MASNEDSTNSAGAAGAIRVLLVDPDGDRLASAGAALEGQNLGVVVESDGREAVARIERTAVDCAVLLGDTPSMDREELIAAVGDIDPLLPVLVLDTEACDEAGDENRNGRAFDESAGEAPAGDRVVEWLDDPVEELSFGRLADHIRAAVARGRTARANRAERQVVDRLERQIRLTRERITALHRVAMVLNGCRSTGAVYRETVDAAEQVLDLEICFAFEADEAAGEFRPRAQSSTPTDRALEPVPLDEGGMGETYRSGEALRVLDMERHAAAEPTFGAYRSGLSVPIGEYGVLQAVSDRPGAFDDIDLELAELLGTHAASALRRLEYEAELRTQRDRYGVLFDSTADCIVETEFVDDEPVVRNVNPAFESVFGYEAGEVVGRSLDEVIVPDDQRTDADTLNRRGRAGERVRETVVRETADGERRFLLRIVHLEGENYYAVYTDVTERRNREVELEHKNEQLSVLNRLVGHDIRNDVAVIQALGETIRPHVEPAGVDTLDQLLKTSDHIVDLTSTAGEYARTVAGDESLSLRTVALNGVLSSVIEEKRDTYVDAEFVFRQPVEVTVEANELLGSVIGNLLSNAARHNDDPTVEVSVEVHPETVTIAIADDGQGVPDEQKRRAFERGTTGADSGGTGLGLHLVRTLVEEYGGDVRMADNDPQGTVVEVELRRTAG